MKQRLKVYFFWSKHSIRFVRVAVIISFLVQYPPQFLFAVRLLALFLFIPDKKALSNLSLKLNTVYYMTSFYISILPLLPPSVLLLLNQSGAFLLK